MTAKKTIDCPCCKDKPNTFACTWCCSGSKKVDTEMEQKYYEILAIQSVMFWWEDDKLMTSKGVTRIKCDDNLTPQGTETPWMDRLLKL